MIWVVINEENDTRLRLEPAKEDAIIKGLRLLLLVGNDEETKKAAEILDAILPRE
jgi:sulfur transfer protein SufE